MSHPTSNDRRTSDRRTSDYRAVLVGLILILLTAGAAAADHRPSVTVYHDVHFEGRSETFFGDVADFRGSYVGNDTVSSIVVDPGCHVKLYRHAYFRGRSVSLGRDFADLRGTWVGNDEVSSMRIQCRRGFSGGRDDGYDNDGYGRRYGVTVHSDSDYRGRTETFCDDDPDLRDNPIRQDTISSVAVDRGCRVILFSDVGFRGSVTVLDADHPNLRHSQVGNDRISSLRVECGALAFSPFTPPKGTLCCPLL